MVRPPNDVRSGALENAHAVCVRPFLLQVVLARADLLVVAAVRRATERVAEIPGALVAVLVALHVVPGVAERVGDRLVVLVADDVDRRVCIVAVRMLARITRARHEGRVRLVRVQRGARAVAEGAVVRAEVRERAAAGAVAVPTFFGGRGSRGCPSRAASPAPRPRARSPSGAARR